METQYVEDREFGLVAVDVRPQARHLIAHVMNDGSVRVTVPPLTPLESVRRMLEGYRERIRKLRVQVEERCTWIDFDFSVETDLLSLRIEPVEMPMSAGDGRLCFRVARYPGATVVKLPSDVDFSHWQETLREALIEQLRWQAHELIPPRLQELARKHGFSYKKLTFKKSRTNWGSCSTAGNINISVFLLLVPSRLVDYVLVHELCHTRHPDHSPAFWALVDKVLGSSGSGKACQRELRAYRAQL